MGGKMRFLTPSWFACPRRHIQRRTQRSPGPCRDSLGNLEAELRTRGAVSERSRPLVLKYLALSGTRGLSFVLALKSSPSPLPQDHKKFAGLGASTVFDATQEVLDATPGKLYEQRMHCVRHGLQVVEAACKAIAKGHAGVETAITKCRAVNLNTWITSRASDTSVVLNGEDWFANEKFARDACDFADRIILNTFEGWKTSCTELATAMQSELPSRAVVGNPDLLTNSEMKKTVMDTVDAFSKLDLKKQAEGILSDLKSFDEKAPGALPVWKERVELQKVRKHMKLCIGLDFALREITKLTTAEKPNLAEGAKRIITTLLSKGIGEGKPMQLPSYMQICLKKMRNSSEAAAAASSATPSGPAGPPAAAA